MSYDTVKGYINLCLAILKQARQDYNRGELYNKNGEPSMKCVDKMWSEFIETDTFRRGVKGQVNTFELACGLAQYIGDNNGLAA